jgi:hypothetical protein
MLAFLVFDATGVEALVRVEPCTGAEDTQPDGTCPAMCVRCACGLQVIVPAPQVSAASVMLIERFIDLYSRQVPLALPSKIFHVPKSGPRIL